MKNGKIEDVRQLVKIEDVRQLVMKHKLTQNQNQLLILLVRNSSCCFWQTSRATNSFVPSSSTIRLAILFCYWARCNCVVHKHENSNPTGSVILLLCSFYVIVFFLYFFWVWCFVQRRKHKKEWNTYKKLVFHKYAVKNPEQCKCDCPFLFFRGKRNIIVRASIPLLVRSFDCKDWLYIALLANTLHP